MAFKPLYTFGQDAAVGCRLMQVRHLLHHFINACPLVPVEGGAVADHDLRGILIGHHDGWLGQLGSRGVWVVTHQRFVQHAHVLDWPLLKSGPDKKSK